VRLEGLHHVTGVTADPDANEAFYAGLLGLRPLPGVAGGSGPNASALAYGDDAGRAGSIITFFVSPGAASGRAGDGTVASVAWRIADAGALDYWARRLRDRLLGPPAAAPGRLRVADPDGLVLELVIDSSGDPPLVATGSEVPAAHMLRGLDGLDVYGSRRRSERALVRGLGAEVTEDRLVVGGGGRRATCRFVPPPEEPGADGPGALHHVAWAAPQGDLGAWHERARAERLDVTPIIERGSHRTMYWREPGGVLFEVATIGPRFGVGARDLGKVAGASPHPDATGEAPPDNVAPLRRARSRLHAT
jgi:glyoxalase family protein